ncbi:VOC family protein [Nocardia sp. NBC_00565]|uniref:VOC family protein n=1 Tax=Nocardia sp. NBC_00565 TaxID=2975993 RepID=UPI002E7FB544|nr:VOC family protein [Nocardia sp. NBC_00565]WUC07451.1 VOC family protein [Nocardia sp. NBC_00565]
MTPAVTPQLVTGHIGLNVSDLDRSVDFYRRAFGFEQLAASADDDKRWAFLGANGKLMVTLWQQSDGTFSIDTPGLHHLSFQVDTIEQVRSIEALLRELSVTFAHDGVVAHGEGVASGGIFFTDPDGIRLEVYAPNGAESAPAPSGAAPTCGFF